MTPVEAIWRQVAGHARLTSPGVGLFEPGLSVGALVHAGDPIGWLDVLGVRTRVVAPAHARGVIRVSIGAGHAQIAVDHDRLLYVVDPDTEVAAGAPVAAAAAADHLVFRAPTSGRYYGRPAPGKPGFVEPGAELAPGTTVCMLEVMKTFHRVTYGGAPARVRAVLVADGADVNAGDPLLAFEPQ